MLVGLTGKVETLDLKAMQINVLLESGLIYQLNWDLKINPLVLNQTYRFFLYSDFNPLTNSTQDYGFPTWSKRVLFLKVFNLHGFGIKTAFQLANNWSDPQTLATLEVTSVRLNKNQKHVLSQNMDLFLDQ